MDSRQNKKLMLEQFIDVCSLADVLDSLAEIAHAKAQHIEENWQDVHSRAFGTTRESESNLAPLTPTFARSHVVRCQALAR